MLVHPVPCVVDRGHGDTDTWGEDRCRRRRRWGWRRWASAHERRATVVRGWCFLGSFTFICALYPVPCTDSPGVLESDSLVVSYDDVGRTMGYVPPASLVLVFSPFSVPLGCLFWMDGWWRVTFCTSRTLTMTTGIMCNADSVPEAVCRHSPRKGSGQLCVWCREMVADAWALMREKCYV